MSLDELKCDYTIKPISGMEAVQKNFVELSSNGDRAAYNLLQGKVSDHTRISNCLDKLF
jgi:hypothetical protein